VLDNGKVFLMDDNGKCIYFFLSVPQKKCSVSPLFIFFVVPHQFAQDIGEWLENQILIPDFHCPGATLVVYSHFAQLV